MFHDWWSTLRVWDRPGQKAKGLRPARSRNEGSETGQAKKWRVWDRFNHEIGVQTVSAKKYKSWDRPGQKVKGLRPARPKSEGSETGSTLKNEVQTVSTPFFRGSDGLNTIFQGLDRLNLEKGNFSVCCVHANEYHDHVTVATLILPSCSHMRSGWLWFKSLHELLRNG